ncbi:MAG: hypothetical protein Q9M43_16325 [Sulfurimonas sp.]|nr:hypothetical protein [Sulfurimonas sp.]
MFDIIIFQEPIYCNCKIKIESTQVKIFDRTLKYYRVGDVVNNTSFMGIFEDEVLCDKCNHSIKIYIAINYQLYLGIFRDYTAAKQKIDSFDMMQLWKLHRNKFSIKKYLFKEDTESFLMALLEKMKDAQNNGLFSLYDEYFKNTNDPKEMIRRFIEKDIVLKTIKDTYNENCEFEIDYYKQSGNTFITNDKIQDQLQKEYIYEISEDITERELIQRTQEWIEQYNIPLKVVLKSTKTIKQKEAFLDELISVYNRYGYSLSHEDTQGGFKIDNLSSENIEWLKESLVYEKINLIKDK